MIIMANIPEWQYPLYKEPDKVAYAILEKIGKSKLYPKLVGSKEEINDFLKLLVVSQKMKYYRKFRDIALNEFKKKEAKIQFIGNDDEVSEFFVRFLLSQLLQDWRCPLMAVLLECLQDKKVKIAKLNNLLKIWDYTKVF